MQRVQEETVHYYQTYAESAENGQVDQSCEVIFELCQTYLADRDGDVVVLRVFMDESGTHEGSQTVISAACYGKAAAWREFTRIWNRRKGKVSVYHATDAQNLRGEFKGWTSEQVGELAKHLLPTIPECGIHAYIVCIDLRAYKKALEPHADLRAMLGVPFEACVQWNFSGLRDFFNRHRIFEPLAFIHEKNDEHKRQIEEAFEFEFGGEKRGGFTPTLTFANKEEFVPLQAADVIAYELNRYTRQGRPDWNDARRALQAINPRKENFTLEGLGEEEMPGMVARLRQIKMEHDFMQRMPD
jgi:hypothetical protein